MERLRVRPVLALLVIFALLIGASSAKAANRLFVAAGKGGLASGPHSGPATDAGLAGLSDVAMSPDGSFLVVLGGSPAERPFVVRVDPKGWIRRVAGGKRAGFSGDGGPATSALLGPVSDVAVTSDGGFLIADPRNCRVRRVSPSGIITTVAGSVCPTGEDRPGPAPGDGGPVTAARIAPVGVAAMPDGGFIISEGNRVRRVTRDGRISTVAGRGAGLESDGSEPVDGRPATSVRLVGPTKLGATSDGGFLVTDGYGQIWRVRPDGIIVFAAGSEATLSDTGAIYSLGHRPERLFGPLPRKATLIAARPGGYFTGWGDPARRTSIQGFGDAKPDVGDPPTRTSIEGFGDVEPVPDGGLLFFASDGTRVVFSTPPAASRLGIAIARETLPALLRRRLRFRLSRAARVEVRIYRGRKVVARRTVSGRSGLNTVRLPRRLKRGLRYARVRADSADGAVASNGLRVLVGAWLPKKVAVGQLELQFVCSGECGGIEDRIKRCRRFGARRVDCVMGVDESDTSEPERCTAVVSAVLRRSGYLYLRRYGCRKRGGTYFRERPRYRGRARQAAPL